METEEKGVFEKKTEKVEEAKKKGRDELIAELTEVLYNEAKKEEKIFITLLDKSRNYWNSGDELHYIIVQGRCRELPEDITPTLRHAMSEDNKLLREASNIEIRNEMTIRAEEHLISTGKIKALKKKEEPLKL